MKTRAHVYVNHTGQCRITKGGGITHPNEVEIELTIEIPDALFRRSIMRAEVTLPEPVAMPEVRVTVAEALAMAKALQIDLRQIEALMPADTEVDQP